MTYILFFLVAIATGLTARLIPTLVGEASERSSGFLDRHPLRIFLTTWAAVFALLLVVAG